MGSILSSDYVFKVHVAVVVDNLIYLGNSITSYLQHGLFSKLNMHNCYPHVEYITFLA
jgi:hypothetical protein